MNLFTKNRYLIDDTNYVEKTKKDKKEEKKNLFALSDLEKKIIINLHKKKQYYYGLKNSQI